MLQDVRSSFPKLIASQKVSITDHEAAIVLEVETPDIRKTELLVGDFVSKPIVESECSLDYERLLLGRGLLPSWREISQRVISTPAACPELRHDHRVSLRVEDRRQFGERYRIYLKGYVRLWRCYTALLVNQLYDKDIFAGKGIVRNARLLESDNGTYRSDQLLMHHSGLLLNLSKRSLSSISRFLVGAVYFRREDSVCDEKYESNQFRKKLGIIPPIALFFAGYFVAGVGWWKLRFRCTCWQHCCLWAAALVFGILISLWGGWIFVSRVF